MTSDVLDAGPFFHGTKADRQPGDLLHPGYRSNYGERKVANFLYLTATMDAAIWGRRAGPRRRPRPDLPGRTGRPGRERPEPHRPALPRQPHPFVPHPRPATRRRRGHQLAA